MLGDFPCAGEIKTPCMSCDHRHAKCHSDCEDYFNFRADMQKRTNWLKDKERIERKDELYWKTAGKKR